MKKRSLILIFILLVIAGFRLNSESVGASEIQEGIAKKIIRFHVIANSDSEEDQALKLEVKEEVLEYMKGLLEEASDVDESRKILKENAKNICLVAENAVRERGYDYEVNTFLEDRYFPVKTYGNYTFPPGVYEAFCVEIGSHQGKNWWCVMYPPLCFSGEKYTGEVRFESGIVKWFRQWREKRQHEQKK